VAGRWVPYLVSVPLCAAPAKCKSNVIRHSSSVLEDPPTRSVKRQLPVCTRSVLHTQNQQHSIPYVTSLSHHQTLSYWQRVSVTMSSEPPKLEVDPKYDDYDFPTVSPNNQSGHPGHTTPQQDAQVFQLRAMLEQAGCTKRLDTLTMVRWIRKACAG
jgi:hypothetical protein